jgi:hypothetical protein
LRERALTFGPAHLVGILTEPDPDRVVEGAPVMVILNSGILHRAGASRMYVRVARAMAELGVSSFRFDFSGIGDSEVRRESIPIEQRFIVETREAMDYLETVVGVDRFVLGGLCSGADGAFWTAMEDERAVGVWQIDAFCYRTVRYHMRRYGLKVLNPSAWLNSVKARLPEPEPAERDEEQFVKPEYRRVFPPKEVVDAGLSSLVERDVELFFFFTGGIEEYNYEEQHFESFPQLVGRAELVHLPDSTHTVTDLGHQERLLEALTRWAARFTVSRGAVPAG